ncbi:peptidase inhibitor family I36 protein [Micromonospora sp. NBC_01638]|uniref:peptidase inhibitor family I36 protein n=1 Tax=Micromonospora sp. NBC_01638 TaxID=2975982 RepID=UPI0038677F69
MRMARRFFAALGLTVAIILGAPLSAASAASPSTVTTLAAWDCPVGDFCAWSGANGTGSRCNWTDADNDWWAGATVCSWSKTTSMKSFWNRGTSTSYPGVHLYLNANYGSEWYCAVRGSKYNGEGWMRSHRWQTGSCN